MLPNGGIVHNENRTLVRSSITYCEAKYMLISILAVAYSNQWISVNSLDHPISQRFLSYLSTLIQSKQPLGQLIATARLGDTGSPAIRQTLGLHLVGTGDGNTHIKTLYPYFHPLIFLLMRCNATMFL